MSSSRGPEWALLPRPVRRQGCGWWGGIKLPITETHMTKNASTDTAKPPSKQQLLADLVVRDEGATLDEMISATGWLPHTTRAALTGLKKKGYALSSDKVDGVRTYRAVAPE